MSEWAAKRFWKDVTVTGEAGAYGIALDGRPVKTPAKVALTVPARALADEIAAEWDAVDEGIDPNAMPFTRSANAAIDKVAVQFNEVVELLAAYGGSVPSPDSEALELTHGTLRMLETSEPILALKILRGLRAQVGALIDQTLPTLRTVLGGLLEGS